ncbi:MAG TPA: NAD(P)-binding domain-containing protein [Candidatus Acidoferrum sp.]|nr:NAD(P)-binding domain-containing protein [Candidatus Acidoferrum sp.]
MLDTAIVGAGPYGLSIAAHLRKSGISFRIFGRPMESWREHMPKGMMLKSDGFASNLYEPDGSFTLEEFCAQQGIAYSHTDIPVRLDTFANYGVAFRDRFVPELEERNVSNVSRLPEGFLLTLDNGEQVRARRVVLAVGITHFDYIPKVLAHLPEEFVSHSYKHHALEPFRGREVVVIGGGASAIGLAGLLHEAGCRVQLVAREKQLKFHTPPAIGKRRSLWQRIRSPQSGLGPGLKSRFFANFPWLYRHLPEQMRIDLVRTSLGPSGGWTTKEKVIGQVPLLLGCSLKSAEVVDGQVRLTLRVADGTERDVLTSHIIVGTGYKVDIERLTFLSPELRRDIALVESSPVLSSSFESSVPGLYFVGLAAAYTFGPVMRFAFGAGFAARRITKTILRTRAHRKAAVSTASVVASTSEQGTTAL